VHQPAGRPGLSVWSTESCCSLRLRLSRLDDSENSRRPPILAISALHQDHPIPLGGWLPLPMIFHKIRKNDPNFDVSLGPYGGGGSSISFSAAHSKGFWYRFSAMTVPEKVHGVGSSGSAHRSVKFCARIRASSPLRGEGIYPVTHLTVTVPRPGPVGREPRKGVLPGAGRVSRASMHVQPQRAAGGLVARCGCACAVQHRLQRRTRTAVRTGATLDAGRTCYRARA